MLSKKISSIILAASLLAPTTVVVENFDSDCVEAATNFVDTDSLIKSSESPSMPLYGIRPDINHDGKVDINDYTILKKYINSDGQIEIDNRRADVNFDGNVDFRDLLALRNLV